MALPDCTDRCVSDQCFSMMVGAFEHRCHVVKPAPKPRFQIPEPEKWETHDRYFMRMCRAFEEWVNAK